MSQTPKNSTIKVIEPEQNTRSEYQKYTTLLYKQLLKKKDIYNTTSIQEKLLFLVRSIEQFQELIMQKKIILET